HPTVHLLNPLHSFPTRRSSDLSALPGSTTVPEMVPVVVCARSGIMAHVLKMSIAVINSKRRTSSQQISIERMRFVMVPSPHLGLDRKSTRLNSSHDQISYAVFC